MTTASDIFEYISLLEQFSEDEISLTEFETAYFRLFKAEKRMFEEPLYEILNNVFTALDVHVEDGIKVFSIDLTTEELTGELKQGYLDLLTYLKSSSC